MNNPLSLLLLCASATDGYLTNSRITTTRPSCVKSTTTSLPVSIGLGPEEKKETKQKVLVAGVDYEIPDHEEYRLSRRSKFDVQCDEWYGSLLGEENGILGSLANDARTILTTPVPLVNDVRKLSLPKRGATFCISFICMQYLMAAIFLSSVARSKSQWKIQRNGLLTLPPDCLGLRWFRRMD